MSSASSMPAETEAVKEESNITVVLSGTLSCDHATARTESRLDSSTADWVQKGHRHVVPFDNAGDRFTMDELEQAAKQPCLTCKSTVDVKFDEVSYSFKSITVIGAAGADGTRFSATLTEAATPRWPRIGRSSSSQNEVPGPDTPAMLLVDTILHHVEAGTLSPDLGWMEHWDDDDDASMDSDVPGYQPVVDIHLGNTQILSCEWSTGKSQADGRPFLTQAFKSDRFADELLLEHDWFLGDPISEIDAEDTVGEDEFMVVAQLKERGVTGRAMVE